MSIMYKELWSAAEDTAKSQRNKVPDLNRIHSSMGGEGQALNKYPQLGKICQFEAYEPLNFEIVHEPHDLESPVRGG